MAAARHVAGMAMIAASVGALALRLLGPRTEGKKRAAPVFAWLLIVAAGTYNWLEPSNGDGVNPGQIIVFIMLGLGTLFLFDHVVDRYRARRSREAPSP